MFLIVGLGNPGLEYSATRHNAGFMAVDAICERHGFSSWRRSRRFSGETCSGSVDGFRSVLLKPSTWMNLSGVSVRSALDFHKASSSAIVVLHDEIDLPLGKVRSVRARGAAGHNGVRSVIEHVGRDFSRVRLGVGRSPHAWESASQWTLKSFSSVERSRWESVIESVSRHFGLLLGGRSDLFLNRVSLDMADSS